MLAIGLSLLLFFCLAFVICNYYSQEFFVKFVHYYCFQISFTGFIQCCRIDLNYIRGTGNYKYCFGRKVSLN